MIQEKQIIELVKMLGECIGFLGGLEVTNNGYDAQVLIENFHEKVSKKFDVVISYIEQKESVS